MTPASLIVWALAAGVALIILALAVGLALVIVEAARKSTRR